VIDEPELGLHPSALAELAGMVEIASRYAQVVLSTQSPRLLDEFEPENVVVVERDPITKSSFFPKLNPIQLKEWLERYSLSELWEKNVLGGKP
jgi:predicted ATPase